MNPNNKTRINFSNRGASIVEVLISMVIFALTAAVVTGIFSFASINLKRLRLNATRVRIVESMAQIAGSAAALRASSLAPSSSEPFNNYFDNCATGGDWSQICYHKNQNGAYSGFRMYLPAMENITTADGSLDLITSGAVTGTPDYPMRFSAVGVPCDTSQQTCAPEQYPIEVISEFLPYCPTLFEGRARLASTPGNPEWDVQLPSPAFSMTSPDAYQYFSNCWAAQNIKVKITVRPSANAQVSFPPVVATATVACGDIAYRW
jgi:Tfp pilus assembly protein PilV